MHSSLRTVLENIDTHPMEGKQKFQVRYEAKLKFLGGGGVGWWGGQTKIPPVGGILTSRGRGTPLHGLHRGTGIGPDMLWFSAS